MFRNIVWCGGVLAALLAAPPHARAAAPTSAMIEQARTGCCDAVPPGNVEPLAERGGAPADDAPRKNVAADFAEAALAGFDWMTPVLAAIGAALAWLLMARGPFV